MLPELCLSCRGRIKIGKRRQVHGRWALVVERLKPVLHWSAQHFVVELVPLLGVQVLDLLLLFLGELPEESCCLELEAQLLAVVKLVLRPRLLPRLDALEQALHAVALDQVGDGIQAADLRECSRVAVVAR